MGKIVLSEIMGIEKRAHGDEIINTDFISRTLCLAKDKLGAEDYFIYFCDRKKAKNGTIQFDIFNSDWESVEDESNQEICEIIKKCYLDNTYSNDTLKDYAICIPSQIGCLGVVLFSNINFQNDGTYVQAGVEQFVTNSMSALGHAMLSKLCIFDADDGVEDEEDDLDFDDFLDEFEKKRSLIGKYIPFGNRKCVTMFVDIRNFTQLQAEWAASPDQKELQFNLKFSNLIEESSKNHYGIVNGFWGGSALIVLNVLLHEKIDVACRRALCAANEIKKSFHTLLGTLGITEEFIKQHHIKLGIGGNAGNVFFFGFGYNDSFHNYNCLGALVSEAKKLERFSGRSILIYDAEEREYKTPHDKPDHIIISEGFYDIIKNEPHGMDIQDIEDMEFPTKFHEQVCKSKIYGFSKIQPNPCGNKLKCKKCDSDCEVQ
ncbi:MAG: hypothetical protein FWD44_00075 [Oscillospiraceae bacterium]|nr:hypothetical protein [Oscillospiraceae bacterium]